MALHVWGTGGPTVIEAAYKTPQRPRTAWGMLQRALEAPSVAGAVPRRALAGRTASQNPPPPHRGPTAPLAGHARRCLRAAASDRHRAQ